MKTCDGCKHAAWRRTKADKLHPSGEGRCQYPYKAKPLPASMYWSWGNKPVEPSGGYINRHEELPEHCVYYEREAK